MISRAIITQSLALLLPVVWASYTILTSKQIYTLLTHIKLAGVYLVGIVVVAHLSGGIDYGHHSSSEASNGLAPVQLSGYLGLITALFFFRSMNKEERVHQWMNIGIFIVCDNNHGTDFLSWRCIFPRSSDRLLSSFIIAAS